MGSLCKKSAISETIRNNKSKKYFWNINKECSKSMTKKQLLSITSKSGMKMYLSYTSEKQIIPQQKKNNLRSMIIVRAIAIPTSNPNLIS